jgi:hypothetical protein
MNPINKIFMLVISIYKYMFGKLTALFFVMTIITIIVVIFSVGSQGQLQSVDENCGSLSLQHPHNGYITVHNASSGMSVNYTKGTFCTYQLNYYYDWGLSWLAPMIAAIITAVFAIIYFGYEYRINTGDDIFDETDSNN